MTRPDTTRPGRRRHHGRHHGHHNGHHGSRSGEQGSSSVEAVLVATALGLFVGLIILGGRVELANQAVQSAAYDAARSASISRTSIQARSSGQATAAASLSQQGIHCIHTDIDVDVHAFETPLGATGSAALISATVTCTIDVSGLGLPGVNHHIITKTMTSPLDAYRGRS